jgi:hemolysin D
MDLDQRASPRLLLLPLYIVGILVVAFIVSSFIIQVDCLVSARGVLVPPDNSVRVTALRSGVVRQILVRDGQTIEAGQPLVRLDVADDEVAIQALAVQIAAARAELAKRKQLIAARRELAALKAKFIAGDRSSEQAGIEAQHSNIERLQRAIAGWETELARQTPLAAKKVISATDLESVRRQADQTRTEQIQAVTGLAQKELLIKQLQEKEAGTTVEFNVELLQDELSLQQGKSALAALEQKLAAAESQRAKGTLVAPKSGVVHELAVRNEGEFIADAQVVCRLVPRESQWVAEIELAAADVGFVRRGQSAHIKLDAFAFEDFGAVNGTVEFIAPDASPAGPGQLERKPLYTVRIRLDEKPFLARQNERLEFRSGMTLTGELVDRRESLISLMLRPLRKASGEVGMR